MSPRANFLLASAAAACATVASACFTGDAGLSPPHDSFYYPTGLAVSAGGSTLYVVNSDFDLQYNGGTVQTLDLGVLRPQIEGILDGLRSGGSLASACRVTLPGASAPTDLGVNSNDILSPGPCGAIPAAPFVRSFATIGAFASGVALVHRRDQPGARLFVPVRGDPSVTYFDIDEDAGGAAPEFRLDCGGTDTDHRCAPVHKIGQNPYDNLRRLVLPVEPVGIAADDSGESLVIAHQTDKAASLIVNAWGAMERPTLQFYLTNLPDGPTEVAAIPRPALFADPSLAAKFQPAFLLTYRAAAEVDLLRFQDDAAAAPARPFITRAAAFGITVNASGADSRGIAIDARGRTACEKACAKADLACLRACTSLPISIYIANRSPPSLLVGRVETTIVDDASGASGEFDSVNIYDSIPLTFGASKIAVGDVIDKNGELQPRVFAVAFDSRFVFEYDPVARRIDSIVRTGRGPHAIAFDVSAADDGTLDKHAFLLVGHFTDSYIGVVDLDMRHPETFGNMFASVGAPLPPREAK